jgi:hypothetical protein
LEVEDRKSCRLATPYVHEPGGGLCHTPASRGGLFLDFSRRTPGRNPLLGTDVLDVLKGLKCAASAGWRESGRQTQKSYAELLT